MRIKIIKELNNKGIRPVCPKCGRSKSLHVVQFLMTERHWFNIQADNYHGDSAILSKNLCQPPNALTDPIGKCGRCGFQGELDSFAPSYRDGYFEQDTTILDGILFTQGKLGI